MSEPHDIRERESKIRLVIFDIDGVLTDGKLYLAPDGTELKTSSVRDGLGLRLLIDAGIHVAVISGRPSPAYEQRLRKLGVEHIVLSTRVKLPMRWGIFTCCCSAISSSSHPLPEKR